MSSEHDALLNLRRLREQEDEIVRLKQVLASAALISDAEQVEQARLLTEQMRRASRVYVTAKNALDAHALAATIARRLGVPPRRRGLRLHIFGWQILVRRYCN